MNIRRLRQVLRYGWTDAGEISGNSEKRISRIRVYLDEI